MRMRMRMKLLVKQKQLKHPVYWVTVFAFAHEEGSSTLFNLWSSFFRVNQQENPGVSVSLPLNLIILSNFWWEVRENAKERGARKRRKTSEWIKLRPAPCIGKVSLPLSLPLSYSLALFLLSARIHLSYCVFAWKSKSIIFSVKWWSKSSVLLHCKREKSKKKKVYCFKS